MNHAIEKTEKAGHLSTERSRETVRKRGNTWRRRLRQSQTEREINVPQSCCPFICSNKIAWLFILHFLEKAGAMDLCLREREIWLSGDTEIASK